MTDADELIGLSRELTRRLQSKSMESPGATRDRSAVAEPGLLPCDLVETEDAYHITIDVPGVGVDDVAVTVHGRRAMIRTTRRAWIPDGLTPVQVEQTAGGMSRTIDLPSPVEEGAVRAQMAAGVLTIRILKAGEQAGASGPG